MSLNVNQLVKQVRENKEPEVYLPQYTSRFMTSYYRYSLVDLTMKYVMLYEVMSEKQNKQTGYIAGMMDKVNGIIKDSVLGDFNPEKREEMIKELHAIRFDIISRMKSITAYADIMQLYEYVLNRIEDKFADEIVEIDVELFIQEIIAYIFEKQDNMIINSRVQEIIGQLPVRMTKTKYYDLLRDSLSIYKGSQKSSVDGYVYMLKSGAGIDRPTELQEYFPELYKAVEKLESTDFKSLEKPEFYRINGMVQDKVVELLDISDLYVQLQGIVNMLYSYNLSAPYVEGVIKEEITCKELIEKVNGLFAEGSLKELESKDLKVLTKLEGSLETLSMETAALQGVLPEILSQGKLLESLMLQKQISCIEVCEKLISNSVFIDLDEVLNTEIADEAYIGAATKELLDCISVAFEKNPQTVNRAIMASSLNKMPVFFNNSDQIAEYIANSLNQCKDNAEKNACHSIIKDIMNDR
jgi:hypothetical protein